MKTTKQTIHSQLTVNVNYQIKLAMVMALMNTAKYNGQQPITNIDPNTTGKNKFHEMNVVTTFWHCFRYAKVTPQTIRTSPPPGARQVPLLGLRA